MKKFLKFAIAITITTFLSVTVSAFEHDGHHSQVKHNMILYGENEIFISHLVYKAPHNYQVILKIQFPESVRQIYVESKKAYPEDIYIFLLDKMHIGDIADLDAITGTITRTDASDNKTVLASAVTINKADYKVVFFNELPLNLE